MKVVIQLKPLQVLNILPPITKKLPSNCNQNALALYQVNASDIKKLDTHIHSKLRYPIQLNTP